MRGRNINRKSRGRKTGVLGTIILPQGLCPESTAFQSSRMKGPLPDLLAGSFALPPPHSGSFPEQQPGCRKLIYLLLSKGQLVQAKSLQRSVVSCQVQSQINGSGLWFVFALLSLKCLGPNSPLYNIQAHKNLSYTNLLLLWLNSTDTGQARAQVLCQKWFHSVQIF